MQLTPQRTQIIQAIDGASQVILQVSQKIHSHPELGYAETYASGLLAETLEGFGFQVERGFAGLPTSFCARKSGGKGPRVAFLAEYDALPGIGHGCGHNIIATTALAAGIGLGALVEKLNGEVWVMGTPAEETDGGKVVMVQRGVFDGVDAALMVHPHEGNFIRTESLAMDAIEVSYYGKPAHAATAPWEGKNALDAIILLFSNLNALRQQIQPDARLHGIIVEGGKAPNIIPDFAQARFYVRARQRSYLNELGEKFKACAQAAADATGTRVETANYENSFDDMVNNMTIAERVVDYLTQALGSGSFGRAPENFGSVDMGNVSHRLPAVHVLVDIANGMKLIPHTAEFCAAAISEYAEQAILRSGKALALTGYDLLTEEEFLAKARQEYKESLG